MSDPSSKLDMSLDAISKASGSDKPRRGGRGGARRGGGRGGGAGQQQQRGRGSRGGRGGARGSGRGGGGGAYQNPLARDDYLTPADTMRGPRRGGNQRGWPEQEEDQWQHDMYREPVKVVRRSEQQQGRGGGFVVLATNLKTDTTAEDMADIFAEIGEARVKTIVNEDGEKLGEFELVFRTKAEADRAIEEFDEAEVENRVMYLSYEGPDSGPARRVETAAPPPRARPSKRPAPTAFDGGYQAGRGVRRDYYDADDYDADYGNAYSGGGRGRGGRNAPRGRGAARGRARGRGGRGGRGAAAGGAGRGRGRGRDGGEKKSLTAEELDAEMDSYHNPSAASAAGTGNKKGRKGGKAQKETVSAEDLDKEMDSYRAAAANTDAAE